MADAARIYSPDSAPRFFPLDNPARADYDGRAMPRDSQPSSSRRPPATEPAPRSRAGLVVVLVLVLVLAAAAFWFQKRVPDFSRYDGTWTGTQTGEGTLVLQNESHPFTFSCPYTVTISEHGRTASFSNGDGEMQWPDGDPKGQKTTKFTVDSHPAVPLQPLLDGLVGEWPQGADGKSCGGTARLGLIDDGATLRLKSETVGAELPGGVTYRDSANALLKRVSGR